MTDKDPLLTTYLEDVKKHNKEAVRAQAAIAAMQGLLSATDFYTTGTIIDGQMVAKDAVYCADWLLKELDK